MNQTQFATAQIRTEVLDDLWNVFQDLFADGGKEKIEIEQGVLGEERVPDEVLARVLEASQVIDDEPALQPLEDGDLYIGFRLKGGPLAFAVILRPAEQAVVGIETFDLRPPIDLETSERMVPVPPADPEGERNAILEEVRAKFDRTLKSDYRSLNDMLDWAAPLLTTTEFRRTVSLVAEAIATRPAQSRSTNIIRLAYNNPNPAWRQPAPSVPWDPAAAAPAPTPAQATVLRTGEVGLLATFVKLIQEQITSSHDQERLSAFLEHIDQVTSTESGVTCIGSLGPEIPSFLQNAQLHGPRGIEALHEASKRPVSRPRV